MKIKNKLLIPVIILFSIIYLSSVGYVIQRMYFRNIQDAEKLVEANSLKYANSIKSNLIKDIYTSKAMAHTFETYKKLPKDIREQYQLDVLKHVVENNPEFLAGFLSRQLFSVDPNWKHEYGRVKQTFYRNNDKVEFESEIVEKQGEKTGSLYNILHLANKDYITEPYFDEFNNGEKILMTSICIPVRENGKFIGLTGVDVSLERLKNIIEELNTDSQQNNFVLSNEGSFIYSDDSTFIGKNFKKLFPELESSKKFTENVSAGKEMSFYITDSITGEEILCTVKPIDFGGDFKPWAMAIQIPKSVVVSEAREIFYTSIIVGLIALIIVFISVSLIARFFTQPIKKIVNFAQELAIGNLSEKLDLTSRTDEFGELAEYLNIMGGNLSYVIIKIKKSARDINKNSLFLKEKSIEISSGTSMQASSAQEVSASMEEMLASVEQNTSNANKTSLIASNSVKLIQTAGQNVESTSLLMNKVAGKISELEELSFQVNLLALNTAIEASHAGEYGKGFTIVAREVKKLARKSNEAAASISLLINQTLEISEQSTVSLKNAAPEIIKTSDLLENITKSGQEQSNGAKQVNNAVNLLNSVIQKNSQHAEQMLENSRKFENLANEFNKLVKFFKT